MESYSKITYKGQIRRMRSLADTVLRSYPIVPERIDALSHGENTLFRVAARSEGGSEPAGRYVVRIHVDHPEYRSSAAVNSEMLWLQALRRDAGLGVPEPIPTRDGSLVVRTSAEGIPGERSCVLLRWTEGRFASDSQWEQPRTWARLGEFLGRMHRYSERFSAPAGFVRHRYDAVTSYYGIAFDDMFRDLASRVPAEDLDVLQRAVDRGREATAKIGESPEVFGLVHADLHGGNTLFHRNLVHAIDFDDCGFGPYLYDLARVTGFVRMKPALRKALHGGYRRMRPLAPEHEEHLEPLMVMCALNLYVWAYGNFSNNTRIHDDPADDAREMAQHLRERGG